MQSRSLVCALLLAAAAAAQTGRQMSLQSPAVPGTTATFAMTHPASAAGNAFLFLWSLPFPGALSIGVPGLVVDGRVRVDPAGFATLAAGVLGAGGAVQFGMPIPAGPAHLGFAWDVQGLDLAFATGALALADNDVAARVRTAQQWQAPLLVDAGVLVGAAPLVAVAGDGTAHALWLETTGGLHASTCAPGGAWSPPHVLVGASASVASMHLAAGADGSAIAVWCGGGGFARDVLASRFTPAGGWSAPLTIDAGPGDPYDATVAIGADGEALAVWAQWSGPGPFGVADVIGCRFTPAGGWAAPAPLENDPAGGVSAPAVAIDAAGNVVVAWARTDGVSAGVWANRRPAGGAFGAAAPLVTATPGDANPAVRVAAANGVAVAVWHELDASGYRKVWTARWESAWSAPFRVDANTVNRASDPAVALDLAGNTLVAWCDNDTVRDNLATRRYTAGVGWGAAALIETNDAGAVQPPRIAVDYNGIAHVVWPHRDNAAFSTDVWASRFAPGAGFAPPVRVSGANPVVAGEPHVGCDVAGDFVVGWSQQAPAASHDLRSATLR